DIEYIIVDGQSKDGTTAIIKKYKHKFGGHLKWISEPDQGIYDAMNKGIQLASGDVIGTLNSDDTFYNNEVIEKVAGVFENHPEIDCLYGNLIFIDEENKLVRKWQSKPFISGLFAKSWTPAHPTFYCRKEVFEKYGLYKTHYKIAADVEFMFRMLELNKLKSYFLNETIVSMAIGGISTQGLKSTITITKELQLAYKENGMKLNLPKYLFYKGLKIKEYLFK
ncbi:MAG: glycosyltransferase, partial [Draconibacterium sp.]|nr:glycosyltransferase [Draconibacterium sp.]